MFHHINHRFQNPVRSELKICYQNKIKVPIQFEKSKIQPLQNAQ